MYYTVHLWMCIRRASYPRSRGSENFKASNVFRMWLWCSSIFTQYSFVVWFYIAPVPYYQNFSQPWFPHLSFHSSAWGLDALSSPEPFFLYEKRGYSRKVSHFVCIHTGYIDQAYRALIEAVQWLSKASNNVRYYQYSLWKIPEVLIVDFDSLIFEMLVSTAESHLWTNSQISRSF